MWVFLILCTSAYAHIAGYGYAVEHVHEDTAFVSFALVQTTWKYSVGNTTTSSDECTHVGNNPFFTCSVRPVTIESDYSVVRLEKETVPVQQNVLRRDRIATHTCVHTGLCAVLLDARIAIINSSLSIYTFQSPLTVVRKSVFKDKSYIFAVYEHMSSQNAPSVWSCFWISYNTVTQFDTIGDLSSRFRVHTSPDVAFISIRTPVLKLHQCMQSMSTCVVIETGFRNAVLRESHAVSTYAPRLVILGQSGETWKIAVVDRHGSLHNAGIVAECIPKSFFVSCTDTPSSFTCLVMFVVPSDPPTVHIYSIVYSGTYKLERKYIVPSTLPLKTDVSINSARGQVAIFYNDNIARLSEFSVRFVTNIIRGQFNLLRLPSSVTWMHETLRNNGLETSVLRADDRSEIGLVLFDTNVRGLSLVFGDGAVGAVANFPYERTDTISVTDIGSSNTVYSTGARDKPNCMATLGGCFGVPDYVSAEWVEPHIEVYTYNSSQKTRDDNKMHDTADRMVRTAKRRGKRVVERHMKAINATRTRRRTPEQIVLDMEAAEIAAMETLIPPHLPVRDKSVRDVHVMHSDNIRLAHYTSKFSPARVNGLFEKMKWTKKIVEEYNDNVVCVRDECGECNGDGSSCLYAPCHVADYKQMTPEQYGAVMDLVDLKHRLVYDTLGEALRVCIQHSRIHIHSPIVDEGPVRFDGLGMKASQAYSPLYIVGMNINGRCEKIVYGEEYCLNNPFKGVPESEQVVSIRGQRHMLQMHGRSVKFRNIDFEFSFSTQDTAIVHAAQHLRILTSECVSLQSVRFIYPKGIDVFDKITNINSELSAATNVLVLIQTMGDVAIPNKVIDPPNYHSPRKPRIRTRAVEGVDKMLDYSDTTGCVNEFTDIDVVFMRGMDADKHEREVLATPTRAVLTVSTDKNTHINRVACLFSETRACIKMSTTATYTQVGNIEGMRCGYANTACFIFSAIGAGDYDQLIYVTTGRFVHSRIGILVRGFYMPLIEDVETERLDDVSVRVALTLDDTINSKARLVQSGTYTRARLPEISAIRPLFFSNMNGNSVELMQSDGNTFPCVAGCGYPVKITLFHDEHFKHPHDPYGDPYDDVFRTGSVVYVRVEIVRLPYTDRTNHRIRILNTEHCSDYVSDHFSHRGVVEMPVYNKLHPNEGGCHAYASRFGNNRLIAEANAIHHRTLYTYAPEHPAHGNSTVHLSNRNGSLPMIVLPSMEPDVAFLAISTRGMETRNDRLSMLTIAYDVEAMGTESVPPGAYSQMFISPKKTNPSQIQTVQFRVTCKSTHTIIDRSAFGAKPYQYESCIHRTVPESMERMGMSVSGAKNTFFIVVMVIVAVSLAATFAATYAHGGSGGGGGDGGGGGVPPPVVVHYSTFHRLRHGFVRRPLVRNIKRD